MKLLCPEIIHMMKHKTILLVDSDGEAKIVAANDKQRIAQLKPMLSMISSAQKFIFDSGSDTDEKTTTAIKETAVAMMECKLFHQPHPVMWIEDPYEGKEDTYRNFYLGVEHDGLIDVMVVNLVDYGDSRDIPHNFPNLIVFPYICRTDLSVAEDEFTIIGATPDILHLPIGQGLQEAMYAYRKLIVTLNTEAMIYEKVSAHKGKKSWNGDPRTKPFDHTVIRIPTDDGLLQGSGGNGNRNGKTPRKHLVRGFIWGKHTRPQFEQRWVKPYWRGTNEVEVVERAHYEVRS